MFGKIHDRSFLGMGAWMTLQLKVALIPQAMITTQCPGHRCIDDLTIESSFNSQTYLGHSCAWLIVLTCYPRVFVQPGTSRRPATDAGIKYLYCECIH